MVTYGVGSHPGVGVADVSRGINGEGRPWCW